MDAGRWLKEMCPKCGANNWINLGCLDSDPSKTDPEGCVCWECEHAWVWDEDTVRYLHNGLPIETILDAYDVELVDGRESPE